MDKSTIAMIIYFIVLGTLWVFSLYAESALEREKEAKMEEIQNRLEYVEKEIQQLQIGDSQ